jgi:Gram-negative bacterial TonB protein C-terminal
MRQCLPLVFVVLAALGFRFPTFAQNEPATVVHGGVVLSKLSPPMYPPLAWQAHISGDVALNLFLRVNGTIESVTVASGHPMLAPTALKSAQQSTFECIGCTQDITQFSFTYKFQLIPLPGRGDCSALTDEERNGHPEPQIDNP